MKARAILAGAILAGAAGAVRAQVSATYVISVDDPVLAPGETTTVRVSVLLEPGGPTGVYVYQGVSYGQLGPGGGGFDVQASGAATGTWSDLVLTWPYNAAAIGGLGVLPGTPAGAGVQGVAWGVPYLLCCACVYWSTANPAEVWTGVFRAGRTNGSVELSAHPVGPTVDVRGVGVSSCWNTFEFDALPSRGALITIEGCYPDCDGSGGLSVADFACFQARFAAGDPYADCNGSGGLTIADFTCFQGAFAAGCP